MALWPFAKKANDAAAPTDTVAPTPEPAAAAAPGNSTEQHARAHDAINGDIGPYDGDSLNIEDFDFEDFAIGLLDLGSLKIPLPQNSQVQVEMGEAGPRMLHIVTEYGRITPVAFAAPRSAGQWTESVSELVKGIEGDGLATRLEEGPWGTEVVGHNENGTIRIFGIEGPRWLLRLTLAAPAGMDDALARLGREVAARTFVYRGEEPMLAGNSLPVVLPAALVEQVQQAMQERLSLQEQAAGGFREPGPETEAEQAAAQQMHDIHSGTKDSQ